MNFFLIYIFRLVLVHKNRNQNQKSWKLILRTFILQASCAQEVGEKQSEGINESSPKLPNVFSIGTGTGAVNDKTFHWKFDDGKVCGKRLKKNHNLNAQMRVHQDLRPFNCALCFVTPHSGKRLICRDMRRLAQNDNLVHFRHNK